MFGFKGFINHKKIWVDSMIGMTWGFLSTLVLGTVIGFLAINQNNIFSTMIHQVKVILFYLTPFAIGFGVAYKLKLSNLEILGVILGTGLASHSNFVPSFDQKIIWEGTLGFEKMDGLNSGDVFCALITSIMLVYIFRILSLKNPFNVFLIPLTGITIGFVDSLYLTYLTSTLTVFVEWFLEHSANQTRWAGILLSPIIGMIMGLALSLPTSSAAIALAINIKGDAATAAMAGTAAQMISFGTLTYLSTKNISKSLVISFGSSMLQMKNFSRRPILLLIPVLVSGIAAFLATVISPLNFAATTPTPGMGTSVFFGPIFTFQENGWSLMNAWFNVALFQLSLPFVLTIFLGTIFIKKGIIVPSWMEFKYE